MELNDKLNSDMARQFIRNNNIRSMSKLETLLNEQLKDKTAEEIAEICKPVEGASTKPSPKAAPAKKQEVAPKASKKADGEGKKFERKGKEPREVKVVMEGARGFRFGEVWCNSVRNAEGVAMLESNRPKLIKHAQTLGVAASVIESNDPVKIAKSLTLKLDKQAASAQA